MRITERSIVKRSSTEVWHYVIVPENFQRWNTKIASMEAKERFLVGQPFTTHYLWNNKPLQCISEATEIIEGKKLVLRHRNPIGNNVSSELQITEIVRLQEKKDFTIVTKDVFIDNHGIPWFFIPIIWFVNRFGTTTDPDLLKQMCEREGNESNTT